MRKLSKKALSIGLLIIFSLSCFVILFALQKKRTSVNPFKDCQILTDSCKDQSCKYLFLCNETEFSNCRVYDCGDQYGMEILDKYGNIQNKFHQKFDEEKIQEVLNKCKGSLEILEKKCDGNKTIAQVKVITDGDCKINSFLITVNNKKRIADFEKEGDIYNLSITQCGDISEIIAVGESGIQIK